VGRDRAEVFWAGLASDSLIEHPTHGYAVDVLSSDAKADDSAAEDVHDRDHPVATKQDRFAAEQIHASETVLGLGNQRQP
jgi:hypothetical protein